MTKRSMYEFTLHTSASHRVRVQLCFDAAIAAITLASANNPAHILHSLPFDEITDIYIGKQSPLLLSSHFAATPDNHCMSLIVESGAVVDLEGDSERTIEDTVAAIETAMTGAGLEVNDDIHEDSSADNRSGTVNSDSAVTSVTSGLTFTRLIHIMDTNQITAVPVTVKLSSTVIDIGAESLPLSSMTDIVLGSSSDNFAAWCQSNPTDAALCLTLITGNNSYDLIAHTSTDIDLFLAGIQMNLANDGKAIETEESNTRNTRLSVRGSPMMGMNDTHSQLSHPQPQSRCEDDNPVSFLTQGAAVTWLRTCTDTKAVELVSATVKLQLETDSITLTSSHSSPLTLSLSELTDVFVGPQTPVFQSLTHSVNRDLALSLSFSSTTVIDVIANNDNELSAIIGAIHAVLNENDRECETQQPSTSHSKPSMRASFSVKPPATQQQALMPLEEAVNLLTRGFLFDRYTNFPATAATDRISLWFNSQSSRFGCFFYGPSDGHSRSESESRSIPIHQLKDVLVASKSPIIAKNGAKDGAVSLVAKADSLSLHLVAVGGSSQLKPFIAAIRAVLNSAGATIKERASTNSGTEAVVRLSQSTLVKFIGRSGSSVQVHFRYDTTNNELVCAIDGAKDKERRLALKKIVDLYIGSAADTNNDKVFSIATKKQQWELETQSESQRDVIVNDLRTVILASGNREEVMAWESMTLSDTVSSKQRRVSFMPSAAPLPLPSTPPSLAQSQSQSAVSAQRGSMYLAALTSGLDFFHHLAVDGVYFKQPVLLFYRQNHRRTGQCEDTLYWCDRTANIDRTSPPISVKNSYLIDEITDIFIGKQTQRLQHSTAKSAIDSKCVSLVGNDSELNFESLNESDIEILLHAIQFVCADGGRAVNEAQTATIAESKPTVNNNLDLLLKKAGSKRFSLGPRLTSAANRRLSTLPTRASMLATQESEDWLLPSNLTLQHFQQPALLVTFYHALLGHTAANQVVDSVLKMASDGRIFTGYTSDSRGKWHASTLTLFLDSDGALCWCPFGLKQRHQGQSMTLDSLTEIFLGKQSAALRCVLASGANPARCLSILAGGRGIDVEARNDRTMLGFLFAMFVKFQRAGRTLMPSPIGRHRLRIVGLPSVPPPPPLPPRLKSPIKPSSPTNGVSSTSGIEAEIARADSTSGSVVLVKCKLFYSASTGNLEAFAALPPRAIVASLPLLSIRDIYCGKVTSLLSHPSLTSHGIKDDRCLAFVTKVSTMELVLKDRTAVNALVDDCMTQLKSAGKKIHDGADANTSAGSAQPPPPPLPPRRTNKENTAPAAVAVPPALPSRRLSVMPGRMIGRTASDIAANRRQSIARLNPEPSLALLRNGRRFLVYTNGSPSAPSLMSLYLAASTNTLHWCQPGNRTSSSMCSLPLRDINEMRVGKHAAPAHSHQPHRCLTLMRRSGGALTVESCSDDDLAHTVLAIKTAITNMMSGRSNASVSASTPRPTQPANRRLSVSVRH